MYIKFKNKSFDEVGVIAVKNTGYPSRGPESNFQHPEGSSQLRPASKDLAQTCRQNTNAYKVNLKNPLGAFLLITSTMKCMVSMLEAWVQSPEPKKTNQNIFSKATERKHILTPSETTQVSKGKVSCGFIHKGQ